MNDSKLNLLSTYCSRGWLLLPLHWLLGGTCSCKSSACRSPGKHPLVKGGFKAATGSLAQVTAWHKTWPRANWGLRTGDLAEGGSGVLVVDLDPENGGFETWRALTGSRLDPLVTVSVQTGNLGRHLWFEYPAGRRIPSNAGRLGRGVDIRANGGYVLLPPSVTTHPYRFELSPQDTPLLPLPDWLLAELGPSPGPRAPTRGLGETPVQQGERHQSLVVLAMEKRRQGLKARQMLAELRTARDCNFAGGDHPVSDDEIVRVVTWACQQKVVYKCTDLGNAERYRAQHWEQVRYCPTWKTWLAWDGQRWLVGDKEGAMLRAYRTVRLIPREAEGLDDAHRTAALRKHAARSESASRIESMLRMAGPLMTVSPSELEQHPDLLNVANGVLDLRSGGLCHHDPGLMLTRLVSVDYHPAATCPHWSEFLDLVTGSDQGLARFLQTAVGYSLTGRTDEHALFFLFGTGSNGKTTFMETIQHLLGDYYRRVPIDTLLQTFSQGSAATPYIAEMAGARLVVASEVPENRKLNEALVKDLTGGDLITARYLYGNPFYFQPAYKLWMIGNHMPRITGSDEGIWRRIRVVPFRVTISPEQRLPLHQVMAAFLAELEGILAWAVRGSQHWYRDGLKSPAAVRHATSTYRSDQDLVKQFLEECCLVGVDLRVKKDDLYQAWRLWCQEGGETEGLRRSKKWLTYQLLAQGFQAGGAGNHSLMGIGLLG